MALNNPTRRSLLQSCAYASMLLAPNALCAKTGPKVLTPSGRYLGAFTRERNVAEFLGIRYGMDTRLTRFQKPIAAPALKTTVMAQQFGAPSPQQNAQRQQSEDCLFLNVWTPLTRQKPLPVLVYLHGGAYSNGSSNDPLTHGARLAAKAQAVVITLNHRLNCFGYLFLARLASEFPDSGNAGHWDLVLALEWVRKNVSAFGGDADNITVFGQSGGGAKIATLMAMPQARGLFHKALTMSGQQVTVSGPLNATKRTKSFLASCGLSCAEIKTASTQQLLQGLAAIDPVLGGALYFGPVLDMRALHRHPFWPDAAAQSLHIPMIMGNTILETRAFFPDSHAKLQNLHWANLAERLEPELRVDIAPEWVVEQYRKHYPSYSAREIFLAATTASRSWRGQVLQAEARAHAGAPAFVYQLDFAQAKHTDDIGLIFGTFTPNSEEGEQISGRMTDALRMFIRSGDPGWPAYTIGQRATMVFDVHSRVQNNPRAWERELFARIPYIQPGS